MANYYYDPPIVNTGCYRMIVGILHVLYSDSICTRPGATAVQGLAVWRGAQARCDFAEALRFPAVLQCGAQQILLILLILLPSD